MDRSRAQPCGSLCWREEERQEKGEEAGDMRRPEPPGAADCGLYPAERKTCYLLLVDEAGDWRPGREGRFTSTDKHDLSPESKHYWSKYSEIKKYIFLKIFLETILPAVSQAATGFRVSRRGSGWFIGLGLEGVSEDLKPAT